MRVCVPVCRVRLLGHIVAVILGLLHRRRRGRWCSAVVFARVCLVPLSSSSAPPEAAPNDAKQDEEDYDTTDNGDWDRYAHVVPVPRSDCICPAPLHAVARSVASASIAARCALHEVLSLEDDAGEGAAGTLAGDLACTSTKAGTSAGDSVGSAEGPALLVFARAVAIGALEPVIAATLAVGLVLVLRTLAGRAGAVLGDVTLLIHGGPA